MSIRILPLVQKETARLLPSPSQRSGVGAHAADGRVGVRRVVRKERPVEANPPAHIAAVHGWCGAHEGHVS